MANQRVGRAALSQFAALLVLWIGCVDAFAPQMSSGLLRSQMALKAHRPASVPLKAMPAGYGSKFRQAWYPAGIPRSLQHLVGQGEEFALEPKEDALVALTQGAMVALVLAGLSFGLHSAPLRGPEVELPAISEFIPPQAGAPLKTQYLPDGAPFAPPNLKLYVTTFEGEKVKDHTLTLPQKFME